MSGISNGTIARTIVLAVALGNQILTAAGINPLPFSDDEVYAGITGVLTVGAAIWAWWKNNSFTAAAQKADEVLAELKSTDEPEE